MMESIANKHTIGIVLNDKHSDFPHYYKLKSSNKLPYALVAKCSFICDITTGRILKDKFSIDNKMSEDDWKMFHTVPETEIYAICCFSGVVTYGMRGNKVIFDNGKIRVANVLSYYNHIQYIVGTYITGHLTEWFRCGSIIDFVKENHFDRDSKSYRALQECLVQCL